MIFYNRMQLLLGALLLAVIYVVAWQLQGHLFLNYDASWLMHATRRLLAGGSYAQDFFETNPPLILYLYLPPVILNKLLSVKIAFLFRGYIFLLASFSLGLCWSLMRKTFNSRDSLLAKAFFLTLVLAFLILPCLDLGQRDHLMVVFALPYLLLVVCRLQGHAFNPYYAAGLGLLAGLGFALKPHFLITPLLVEMYFAFHQKRGLAWLRPETLTGLGVLGIYTVSIFIFHPDYVYIVVPYSLRLYYSAVGQPWSALLFNSIAVYCWLSLLLYFILYRENPYKILSTVLALSLVGFLLSYFAQRMVHYYHLIPALSLALLLQVLLFNSLLLGLGKRWSEVVFATLLGVLFFAFPTWIFCSLYSSSQAYKRETLNPLTTFMKAYAQQASVYFFVTAGSYAFPAIDYTSTTMAPRFYFLWMAAGLANQALALARTPEPAYMNQYNRDKNFLINMIADDLYRYKPHFVFVDLSEDKYRIKAKNFNYVAYFSDNQKFRQEWENYHYFTLLEQKGVYKLGVYERKKMD